MVKAFKRISLIIISVAFIVLALANRQPVSLHAPLFPEIALDIPAYLLIFISMAIGIFASGIFGLGKSLRQASASRHQRKDLKKLEHEVALLKVDKNIEKQVKG